MRWSVKGKNVCGKRSEWKGRMIDERWDAEKKEGKEGSREAGWERLAA